jgi:hypothetical protein
MGRLGLDLHAHRVSVACPCPSLIKLQVLHSGQHSPERAQPHRPHGPPFHVSIHILLARGLGILVEQALQLELHLSIIIPHSGPQQLILVSRPGVTACAVRR